MRNNTDSGLLATGTVLDRIVARTAEDVALRQQATPRAELEEQVAQRKSEPIGLRQALLRESIAVIAEVKRASPSRGRFAVEIDPAQLTGEYIAGGARAISVLTDAPFFQGSQADLMAVAEVAHALPRPMPVLRKDFILDEYQVWESAAISADAFLLIVDVLQQERLERLMSLGKQLGLQALVEVHDEEQMRRAAVAGAELIGINNRDLHTFAVDLATTERLAPLAPAGAVIVAESGVLDAGDCRRLADAGARAVLVGEGLILSPNRRTLLQSFARVPIRNPV